MGRKIYIVKSGAFNKSISMYSFASTYFSSKKGALRYANNILEVNKATDIIEDDNIVFARETIKSFDYVGEGGKYKARIVIEWAELL